MGTTLRLLLETVSFTGFAGRFGMSKSAVVNGTDRRVGLPTVPEIFCEVQPMAVRAGLKFLLDGKFGP